MSFLTLDVNGKFESEWEDEILTRSELHLVPVVMDDFKILNKSNNFYVLNANTADNVCDMKYLNILRSDYTCLVLSALAFQEILNLLTLLMLFFLSMTEGFSILIKKKHENIT